MGTGIPTTDKFDHGIPVAHFRNGNTFFGKMAPVRSLVENDDEIKYVLLSGEGEGQNKWGGWQISA